MNCPKCQFENRENAKFCKECGADLIVPCSQCGTVYELGSKFCDECGYKLSQEIEAADPEFSSEGERKHVTVLFSDLSDYTAIAEKLDPEEVKEITSRIFGEVSKIIAKYDGFVEKYAGDAVMALFGAGQSHEDDPVRALQAAREIHRLIQSMSPQYEDKIGQSIEMHTGINTGMVVTGELNLEKGVHGVVGDAVNVAARLSSLANAGEILVDRETYSRTEGYFQFDNLQSVQLKGKSKSVEVHRYVAAKKQTQKIHRLHGLRAELIGRKAEMAQLSEAVQNLSLGKGSVFSIIGAAGTGKSRLIEEFKASLNLDSIQWMEGNAFAYAQNIPYFPLIDLISKAIHIGESDSPDTVREKLESSLDALLEDKENIVPYIGSLYSLDYPEISGVSPEYWKTELQKAMLNVLTALAQRGPTVVCLEDLHWADPSTLELVHFLLSETRHPVLFLCVYRPIISPFPTHHINTMAFPHLELHLRDLSLSEAQNMVESLLKTETVPKELRHFIQRKVEGNPFYLEEAVNSLIESNILIHENGNWKVNGPIAETEISATIQGVITARVDRLELESKRILQEASVIGRSFYYDILKRISEIKENIDISLNGLERFNFIRTKSIEPHLEYIFKHALTQEVVYNGLLKKERREIHERIAHVIEELFADRIPEFYETLAFHFIRSKSKDKAFNYLIKSAEKSLARSALQESHLYFKEAFTSIDKKATGVENGNELILDTLIKWAEVFHLRGAYKDLISLFKENEVLALSINDPSKLSTFFGWLGFALGSREKLNDSYKYLQKALKLGEEVDDSKTIGRISGWLAMTCAELGRIDEAIGYGERAREIFEHYKSDRGLFEIYVNGAGTAYFYKGDSKKQYLNAKLCLEYGQKLSDDRYISWSLFAQGCGHFLEGDFSSAIESYQRAINIYVDPIYSLRAKFLLGLSYVSYGKMNDAENVLKEVIEYSEDHGIEIWGSTAKSIHAMILLIKGSLSKGINFWKSELQSYLERGLKYRYAHAQYTLGNVYFQILRKTGPKSFSVFVKNIPFFMKNAISAARKSEFHLSKAIEAANKIGAKNISGQAHLILGLLYKTKKKFDKAHECLTESKKLFEECEARGYLEQAKDALESM
jgi:class 3 adenylate cyclase/tetratricopeptide (TPR) repeat protein